jgi:sortase (surface protein transpeptidase)
VAPIVPVGIDDDDTVAVPAPQLAGWYRHGSVPGAEGPATLVAHVDYDGRPAAFFDLEDIVVGDEVEVDMSDGSVERFVVTRSTYYDKDDLPVRELFDGTGPSQLHLITCGGEFDNKQRSYRGNVVVTAVPMSLAGLPWSAPGGVE